MKFNKDTKIIELVNEAPEKVDSYHVASRVRPR